MTEGEKCPATVVFAKMQRTSACINVNKVMKNKKFAQRKKIVHGRGPCNINLDIFVCSFLCLPSFTVQPSPFPSINYGV